MADDEIIDIGNPLDEGHAIAWRHRPGGYWWIDNGHVIYSAVQDDFGNLIPRGT